VIPLEQFGVSDSRLKLWLSILALAILILPLISASSPLHVSAQGLGNISFDGAYGVALNPGDGFLYVTNNGNSTVTVVNTGTYTVVRNIVVQDGPQTLAYDNASQEMFVANTMNVTVSAIKGTNTATISVGGNGPLALAYDPLNRDMYVADSSDNNVTLIGPSNQATNISVGPSSASITAIAYNPVTGEMYFADYNDQSVIVINAANNAPVTTIGSSSIGSNSYPSALVYDPSNGDIYVAEGDNNVTAINSANQVANTITIGTSNTTNANFDAIAYDQKDGNIYVIDASNNNVSAINPISGALVGVETFANTPNGIAYDPVNQEMYVTSGNSLTTVQLGTSFGSTSTFGGTIPPPIGGSTSSTSLSSSKAPLFGLIGGLSAVALGGWAVVAAVVAISVVMIRRRMR
jgi:YVTN family beta-propeller protein